MSVEIADRLRCHCPKCIDFHAHFLQREIFEEAHPHSVASCFGRNMFSPDLPAFQRMFHPDMQIEDMDSRGIDCNVLTSADVLQSRAYATPDHERRMTRKVNDECARWVSLHPTRFLGSAVLPLGDINMAVDELHWAKSAGFRVVQLPSNYRGDYLGHARFTDLLGAIHDLGLVIFMHPEGVTEMWYQDYAMWNSIGQSIEEVRLMSSMIYEGVMDRFPGLKIVISHGGGYMPHYMGRLDRNVTDKPYTTKNLSKKPSEYLRDFYYDSCVYDTRTLEMLVERVGIDRIVMGGDYPVAAVDPVDFIATTNLSLEDQGRIAGATAHDLLGLA